MKVARESVDRLAAMDLAWRLNEGHSIEEIAEEYGRSAGEVRRDERELFAAHPGARNFTLPDLPVGIRMVQ